MANQHYEGWGNLSEWIRLVDGGWDAASGNVSFMANGDPLASFDACPISNSINNTFIEFCSHTWAVKPGRASRGTMMDLRLLVLHLDTERPMFDDQCTY